MQPLMDTYARLGLLNNGDGISASNAAQGQQRITPQLLCRNVLGDLELLQH